ncbi:MFS transporter [Rubrivirga marina]|uniref:MFS transporter n=1 Tax=Rubrivirga marina TaxID=1196024 RepID=UPI0015CCA15B|nr:MFS transporter [Rubrivirga marina]
MTLPAFLRTPRLRSAALPFAANGILYGTWASRIPEIQTRTGLSEGTLGLALLGLAVGLVVSAAAAGPLVARLGAHRVTLVALALFALAVVGPGLAVGLGSLAAVLVGLGLTSGLLDVSMNAWAAEVEAADGTTILGACHGSFSLGGMVGAGLGGAAAALGVPLALHFGACGLAFAGAALAQGLGVRAPAGAAPEADGDTPAVALPTGPVAGLAALAFCGLIVEGAMADWGAVFLREVLAASEAVAALGFAAFSACMAAARFGSDVATARVGDARLVRLGAALGAVGLAVCIVAPAVPLAVVGFGLVGLGFAAVVPALFRAASRAPLPPGVGIAAVAGAGYLGFLAGPPVIGFVAEASGLRTSFALLVALAGIVAAGSGAAFRRVRA